MPISTKVALQLLFCCIMLSSASALPISSAQAEDFQWKAAWIGAASNSPSQSLPIFRREFSFNRRLSKATLRVSGLGHIEVHINGRNVTQAVLTPGWTDYKKHIFYDTYDVTALLHSGANAIGALLGNGMYNVEETKGRYTKFAHSFGAPRLILQLDLQFADHTTQTIASSNEWETVPGPITYSSTYGGEDYDARLEQPGWDKPGFQDGSWTAATVVDGPGGQLIPESIPPVQPFERYKPVSVTHPAPGVAVYDLGQNFAGWPEIAASGRRGARIQLVCGELLDEHGRVTQKSANAFPDSQNEFNYVLKGGGRERWAPRFSYWGFRYVEVRTSAADRVKIASVEGRFLHDAVSVDGQFSSSDKLLNRTHQLINRAMLSNMVSVLTDCPHREKLGWLEQTHLAGPSLMYNYGLGSLYAKMADDMQDAQLDNGLVPDIAPEFTQFDEGFRDSPEWGAAVVLSPWTAYQFFGDQQVLRRHYDSMKRYVAYLHTRLQNGLLAYGLGDWYDIGPGDPGESQLTAKGLTATAIYFQALTTMRRIALLLDHPDDAEGFASESEAVKLAFNQAFFHSETGEYDRGSQTANAMPLAVGLVAEEDRPKVLANLIQDIRRHSNHVTAGDIGFHYVVRALTDGGRSDVLYDMLSRTDKPSYGDQLAHGATTLTEAWDANPASSQNHFMLGHAEEWFYRGLAGIDLDLSRESVSRIRIEPAVVGDVRWVSASYHSPLGVIESRWQRRGDVLSMQIRIPKGATATIVLPSDRAEAIRIGSRRLDSLADIRGLRTSGGRTEFVAPGGSYRFTVRMQK